MINSRTPAQTTDHTSARLDRLERLARKMDSQFRIPLTQIRFGWDAVLGLVPGVGDVAAMAPAGYILLEAHSMGAPLPLKGRMLANTVVDMLIGTVPVVGDIFDIGVRSNRRNVALLRGHFENASVQAGGVLA